DLAGGPELGTLVACADPRDLDRDGLTGRVLHLAGDRALPDQVIEPQLVAPEAARGYLLRGAETVTRRADRLVRLLGILHLARVGARRIRHVLAAVKLPGLLARRVDRRLRQLDRVGTHIGDVAVLVQPLRDAHRVLRGEAELGRGVLLQLRGAERRIRRAAVRLALDA